jgi:methylated-DNA-[protein]-cysteine S-methyltransferase
MGPIQPQFAGVLFMTPIGVCGLAFAAHGILGVQLPEADEARTWARLVRRGRQRFSGSASLDIEQLTPDQVPTDIQRTLTDIRALLAGQSRRLEQAPLDLRQVPEFDRRVYALARDIAPGQTRSYGELAALCGGPQVAPAVGRALSRNPFPIIVPCHRVLAAHGKSGGFSARGGLKTKLKLLSLEGAACASLQPPASAEDPTLALPF